MSIFFNNTSIKRSDKFSFEFGKQALSTNVKDRGFRNINPRSNVRGHTSNKFIRKNIRKTGRFRKIRVAVGQVCHIYKSNNNLFMTLTKINGEVLLQLSGGKIGKKGPKKDTPNTAELIGRKFGASFVRMGFFRCILHVHGLYCPFVKSALRGFFSNRVRVMRIVQKVPISHNGVRMKKPRRK